MLTCLEKLDKLLLWWKSLTDELPETISVTKHFINRVLWKGMNAVTCRLVRVNRMTGAARRRYRMNGWQWQQHSLPYVSALYGIAVGHLSMMQSLLAVGPNMYEFKEISSFGLQTRTTIIAPSLVQGKRATKPQSFNIVSDSVHFCFRIIFGEAQPWRKAL